MESLHSRPERHCFSPARQITKPRILKSCPLHRYPMIASYYAPACHGRVRAVTSMLAPRLWYCGRMADPPALNTINHPCRGSQW